MINYSTADPERLYHIGVKPGEIGEYVILPGDPKRCELIAGYFDDPQLVADSREYVSFTGTLCGRKVSVTSTGIGGPSTAIAVEELVRCGAKTLIRVGTCGGMQMDVKSGDVVIATAAVRQDGTSREYAPVEYPAVADYSVVTALVHAAKKLGRDYHVGVVQSKDSFYGQHEPEVMPTSYELQNKWEAYLRLGCLASEMEGAALFTTAAFRRVRAGAAFLVVANQERAKAGLENPVEHQTERTIETVVEAIKILMEEEDG